VGTLTPRVLRVLDRLFAPEARHQMVTRLEHECSAEALGCPDWTPPQMERLWFSIVKLVHANPGRIDQTFILARTDWRDLLMAAGFGEELDAHEKWWAKNAT